MQIAENIMAVADCLSEHYPGGWDNVRSLHIHLQDTPLIPVYITLSKSVKQYNKVVLLQHERLRWSRGSVLAFGTQVRRFKPVQSHRIFRAKKSSARLPSEGK
jgi:hypothetical protein